MKDKRIITRLAAIEGLKRVNCDWDSQRWEGTHKDGYTIDCTYTECHNAIQRIKKGLTLRELQLAIRELSKIYERKHQAPVIGSYLHVMDAEDWCEAVLKALGKWETES